MIEYEIGPDGERTGRIRRRQFTDAYRKAAKSGVWPSMDERAKWSIPFLEPSRR